VEDHEGVEPAGGTPGKQKKGRIRSERKVSKRKKNRGCRLRGKKRRKKSWAERVEASTWWRKIGAGRKSLKGNVSMSAK